MPFRNLPVDAPAPLASLIDAAPGTVSSMGLTRLGDPVNATLLAFAAGESVSEEAYPGDTMYYLVEGITCITLPEASLLMHAGDVLRVPAGVVHAVEPQGAIKLLQISFCSCSPRVCDSGPTFL